MEHQNLFGEPNAALTLYICHVALIHRRGLFLAAEFNLSNSEIQHTAYEMKNDLPIKDDSSLLLHLDRLICFVLPLGILRTRKLHLHTVAAIVQCNRTNRRKGGL